MNVGYARVSSSEENLDLQRDAPFAAGCDASSSAWIRPGRSSLAPLSLSVRVEYVREGDTLVVWRLDRLDRILSHLTAVSTGLEAPDISAQQVAEHFGIARSTLSLYVPRARRAWGDGLASQGTKANYNEDDRT